MFEEQSEQAESDRPLQDGTRTKAGISLIADGGFDPPSRIIGVDFSAAASDAGVNTWVAVATAAGGRARVDRLGPATDILACEPDRSSTHESLVDFIRSSGEAAVGLDFPFAVPEVVMDPAVETWREFVRGFAGRYSDVDAFTSACVDRTRAIDPDRTYLKRKTDERVNSRSPYGFVVDTITYYGIRDILAECLIDSTVRVLPVQDPTEGQTLILETYPAGHLDAVGLPRDTYKGGSEEERTRRKEIIEGLTTGGSLAVSTDIRERAIENTGGDGLDALAAAGAAYEATRSIRGLRLTDHELAAKQEAWIFTGRDFTE